MAVVAGSWFAQVFTSRYPALLRSVTLDSTYQVLRLDPGYTTTVITARRAFAQACARSAACAATAPGDRAWSRISALARRLARAPLTLVNLVSNAGFDPVVYRDLDAAGGVLLRHHDSAPLLRIAALSVGFDDANEPLPGFSDGLCFRCPAPTTYSSSTPPRHPSARLRQYREALRHERRGTFAPFSLIQWTSMDQYTEAYSGCLDRPTPVRHNPPITRRRRWFHSGCPSSSCLAASTR